MSLEELKQIQSELQKLQEPQNPGNQHNSESSQPNLELKEALTRQEKYLQLMQRMKDVLDKKAEAEEIVNQESKEKLHEPWHKRLSHFLNEYLYIPKWLIYIAFGIIGIGLIATMRAFNGIRSVFSSFTSEAIFYTPDVLVISVGLGFALVSAFVYYCFEFSSFKKNLGLEDEKHIPPYCEVITQELALMEQLKQSILYSTQSAEVQSSEELGIKLEILKEFYANLCVLSHDPHLSYREPIARKAFRYAFLLLATGLTASISYFMTTSFLNTILPLILALVGVSFSAATMGPFAPLLFVGLPVLCVLVAAVSYYFMRRDAVNKKVNPLEEVTLKTRDSVDQATSKKQQKNFFSALAMKENENVQTSTVEELAKENERLKAKLKQVKQKKCEKLALHHSLANFFATKKEMMPSSGKLLEKPNSVSLSINQS